jgi:hypothetical protein
MLTVSEILLDEEHNLFGSDLDGSIDSGSDLPESSSDPQLAPEVNIPFLSVAIHNYCILNVRNLLPPLMQLVMGYR